MTTLHSPLATAVYKLVSASDPWIGGAASLAAALKEIVAVENIPDVPRLHAISVRKRLTIVQDELLRKMQIRVLGASELALGKYYTIILTRKTDHQLRQHWTEALERGSLITPLARFVPVQPEEGLGTVQPLRTEPTPAESTPLVKIKGHVSVRVQGIRLSGTTDDITAILRGLIN